MRLVSRVVTPHPARLKLAARGHAKQAQREGLNKRWMSIESLRTVICKLIYVTGIGHYIKRNLMQTLLTCPKIAVNVTLVIPGIGAEMSP